MGYFKRAEFWHRDGVACRSASSLSMVLRRLVMVFFDRVRQFYSRHAVLAGR